MPHYRTIFISDTHLGGACNYSALLNFLRDNDADTWYIVGDFIGMWEVSRSRSWPNEASTVIQKVLRKARKGSKFIILPGNHDSQLRLFESFELGNIEVVDKCVFTGLLGRRLLVIHGDLFDPVMGHAKWLAKIGSVLYDWLVKLNTSVNWFRRLFGMKFRSFSAVIKKRVKEAVAYVGDFEESLLELAKTEGADGVVCGHIHTPALDEEKGYFNCGDWVESLTAIVEHHDGRFELIHHDPHNDALEIP